MDKRQLRKLQQKWYLKLQKEGFEDIEINKDGRWARTNGVNYLTGFNPYSMKDPTAMHMRYHFFNMISTFLAQNETWPYAATLMWHRWVLELYADGVPMRGIVERARSGELKIFKKKLHLPEVHGIIHKYLPLIKQWYEIKYGPKSVG